MTAGDLLRREFRLLDFVPMGVFALAADFRVVFWNSCLEEWTGRGRDAVLGKEIGELYPRLRHPKYTGRVRAVFEGGPPVIFSSQFHGYIIPSALPDGSPRIQHTIVTPMPIAGGDSCYALFTLQDVTELTRRVHEYRVMRDQALEEMRRREAVEEELRRLSTMDPLTDLANRRHFMDRLAAEIGRARRYGLPLSAIMFDVDSFKQINDALGHPVGDEVLKLLAVTIREVIRETDLGGRYGGDEFVILLPHTALSDAEQMAHRLLAKVHALPPTVGLAASISLGVATLRDEDGPDGSALLARADRALYTAKQAGKGRVCS